MENLHGQPTQELLPELGKPTPHLREWREIITTKTQSAEEKRWRERLETKSKLCALYTAVKKKLEVEPYLKFKSRLARASIARLRGGSNFLRIETGRYEKVDREERTCPWCEEIEDERHFLLECDLYNGIR